ncbi:two-component system response regulator BasR [Acidovorax soli]|jgi:two-component system response regulator BasR|uniref:Two-component system response regulator BasR n=1 Tax=Acidovorax soli TaxID=592050 RepID=A0A7X0U9H7_9BURK|nr:response regulator [Acidovorax soli]MBB6559859.1 two-component system response regulator BasR [Acidovorax soli]
MHLLLIEDDLDLGADLQKALKAYGLSSEWVRSLGQAQALCEAAGDEPLPYACAVLDLGLPDGEGLSLLRGWRRTGVALPVIVLTARDALEMRIAGLDAGADDYVIKPVQVAELASRVQAVTRRAAGQSSSTWNVGPLTIDMGRREVRTCDGPVPLSPREFAIVAELARHGGDVVPKHRLARALAPLGEPLEFSALEWHIHNLRRKLGEDSIHTMRGVGYRIAGLQP